MHLHTQFQLKPATGLEVMHHWKLLQQSTSLFGFEHEYIYSIQLIQLQFCYRKVAAGLDQFLQGKMDLQTHTKHRRMDQKQTRSGELLPDTVVNGP